MKQLHRVLLPWLDDRLFFSENRNEMLVDVNNWLSQGLTEEQIREKVPEFAEKYPELFSKLIKKEDLTPIQSMLAMLDRMGEGSISQHQASIIIGKKLVDKFINPELNGNGKK
jgi:hypothetical protein